MTVSRVQRIVKGCKFILWTDIAASKVQRCIAKMQDNGLGKKTANYYLKAFQHFARWMVEDRRAATSPISHLRAFEVKKNDIRRQRRPLEPDEVRRLLEAKQAAEPRFGLSGYEHRLAVESGLRANELRSLRVSCFDFDNYMVTVQDHTARNRKEKTLPLRPDTAAEIRELFARKLPDAQVFKVPFPEVPGSILLCTRNPRESDFAPGKFPSINGDHTEAHAVPSCLNARSRRGTDRANGIETREANALCRHPVEMRCLDKRIAVEADISVPQVVGHQKNDVGFACGVDHCRREHAQGTDCDFLQCHGLLFLRVTSGPLTCACKGRCKSSELSNTDFSALIFKSQG